MFLFVWEMHGIAVHFTGRCLSLDYIVAFHVFAFGFCLCPFCFAFWLALFVLGQEKAFLPCVLLFLYMRCPFYIFTFAFFPFCLYFC